MGKKIRHGRLQPGSTAPNLTVRINDKGRGIVLGWRIVLAVKGRERPWCIWTGGLGAWDGLSCFVLGQFQNSGAGVDWPREQRVCKFDE